MYWKEKAPSPNKKAFPLFGKAFVSYFSLI
jgi:hypothetical protein